jgi:hypothetical protein
MRKSDHAAPAPVAESESRASEDEAVAQAEPESPAALFGQILKHAPTRPSWPIGEPFVAECIDSRHPTLQGRVQIRWEGSRHEGVEQWVPTLHGLAIRRGDRLLLQMPQGGTEPIVIGVVDGFVPRPEPERSAAAQIELKNDEVFRVCGQEGQPLVEIIHDDKGPIVRLLQSDTRVDIKGKLSISAAELELSAVKGKVRIEASDDVDVIGETIHLN